MRLYGKYARNVAKHVADSIIKKLSLDIQFGRLLLDASH